MEYQHNEGTPQRLARGSSNNKAGTGILERPAMGWGMDYYQAITKDQAGRMHPKRCTSPGRIQNNEQKHQHRLNRARGMEPKAQQYDKANESHQHQSRAKRWEAIHLGRHREEQRGTNRHGVRAQGPETE